MDKKEIIKQLEQHLGVKAKYMGTPSFAYQIQTENEIYTITREGIIVDAGGRKLNLESIIGNPNSANDKAVSVDYGQDINSVEITLPLTGHTGISLKNMVNMIYSKQALIQKALSIEGRLVNEDLVMMLSDKKPEALQKFKELLDEVGNDKCPGISFDFKKELVPFKLNLASTEQIKACSVMFALISENAKNLKHTSGKPTETDNEKYTFITWLVRLGMIGDEYKVTRKILLANLEGNAPFRRGGSHPVPLCHVQVRKLPADI